LACSEEAQVLLARLMSGYGRDASLNAKERKAPGTASITQLPGSPSASRSSNFGSEAVDGEHQQLLLQVFSRLLHWCTTFHRQQPPVNRAVSTGFVMPATNST